jgi:hypothetical protein
MPDSKRDALPEDIEELARRYVDLWQDQMTALASDPEFAESLQKVMASMGVAASGLPGLWTAWPAAMSSMMAAAQPGATTGSEKTGGEQEGDGRTAGRRKAGGTREAEAGSAPAAAASHGGGLDLGLLEERLAALEQRLLALEGRGRRAGSRAKGKPKGS